MDLKTLSVSHATISGRELIVTRVINAPRPLVWKAWTTPGHIEKWWGPNGFTTTTHAMDVRAGGVWSYVMHGPDGTDYPNRISYHELKEPELISYLHDSGIDNDPEAFTSTITFDAQGDRTLVTMHAVLPSAERLAELVAKYGVLEGGKQTLARLDEFVRSRTAVYAEGLDVVVSRVFDASPALLFSTWTRPERMAKWFGGPEGFTAPVCELDVRPGGHWRFVMRSPDGTDHPLTGVYAEIVANERLRFTCSLAEHPAEWHRWLRSQMPPRDSAPSTEMDWTVTFAPEGEGTRMTVRLAFPEAAIRDAHIAGGTEHGWSASMQRLAELIPTIA